MEECLSTKIMQEPGLPAEVDSPLREKEPWFVEIENGILSHPSV